MCVRMRACMRACMCVCVVKSPDQLSLSSYPVGHHSFHMENKTVILYSIRRLGVGFESKGSSDKQDVRVHDAKGRAC